MTSRDDRTLRERLHPIHAVLLAGTIPLFLGGLLSDMAYASSYHIQWANFASWLIVGGLIFAGFALLWAIVNLIRADRRSGPQFIYAALLLATWLLSFYNSLTHAKDAWASMPAGLILSVIAVLLACASTWIGLTKFGVGGGR